METARQSASAPPRHTWPWFVLAVLILGLVLAVLWMTAEVRRAKERRAYVIPDRGTNSAPAAPP
jgi:hypothetical protein